LKALWRQKDHGNISIPCIFPYGRNDIHSSNKGWRSGAYGRLVKHFGLQMMTTARRFIRNDEDCDDAVQDALISFSMGLTDLKPTRLSLLGCIASPSIAVS
jgi:hypothetical protein